jgi:hypothetical protein
MATGGEARFHSLDRHVSRSGAESARLPLTRGGMRGVVESVLAVAGVSVATAQSVVANGLGEQHVPPLQPCAISDMKGPWGQYERSQLPRGACADSVACSVWTRDSCPGPEPKHPGPAIRWMCSCESGTWQCQERERTKTACVSNGG